MASVSERPAQDGLEPHTWGRAPDLYGPRHAYREGLLMRRLRKELPAGRVLDAGCGAGSLTLELARRGYDVAAIDSSPEFIQRVRGLLGDGADRVQLGDVEALPFAAGSFDAVVSGEVLEHLDDDQTAVDGFFRVLRPGGLVLVSVPANPWRYDWCDHWAGHRRRYTVDGLRSVLERAGFVDAHVVPYGFPLTGLFHRRVYMPMLRRRLQSGGEELGGAAGAQRRLAPLVRWAFELDTLFIGRRPGYFGLLAFARRPAGA